MESPEGYPEGVGRRAPRLRAHDTLRKIDSFDGYRSHHTLGGRMTFSVPSRRISAALVAVPHLLAAWTLRRAEPIKFARTPHISSQGLIAFAFHDDIWLAKR